MFTIDVKKAIENFNVEKWLLTIDGRSCSGASIFDCIRKVGEEILEHHWDNNYATERAKECLLEDALFDWRAGMRRHPDLFGGATPAIVEMPPAFVFDDARIEARVWRDQEDNKESTWGDFLYAESTEDMDGALSTFGLRWEDVEIEGFTCTACPNESDWPVGMSDCCSMPYCSACSKHSCPNCGGARLVEDALDEDAHV